MPAEKGRWPMNRPQPNSEVSATRTRRILPWILLALLALVILPLAIPIPPPRGVQPVQTLGGPDSDWIEVDGIQFHTTRRGSGQPVFVALHGFGAGTFSWREMGGEDGPPGTVLAYDRPGFGLTERPTDPEAYRPRSAPGHLLGLMDAWDLDAAVLIAHSAGAPTALATARQHPGRVSALILVAPAVGGEPRGPSPTLCALLDTPWMDRMGPLLLRATVPLLQRGLDRAWADPAGPPPAVVADYRRPLRAEGWDRGLWEVLRSRICHPGLHAIPESPDPSLPILVITGELDTIVDPADSRRLARELDAEFAAIPDAGHLPHEERPGAFLAILREFLQSEGIAPAPGELVP